MTIDTQTVVPLIDLALTEDLGDAGDITSALLPDDPLVTANFVARAPGVFCGGELIELISTRLAERMTGEVMNSRTPDGRIVVSSDARHRTAVHLLFPDGRHCNRGDSPAWIRGPRRHILELERTALNFLTRMSGVATLTRRYVDEAARGAASNVSSGSALAPGSPATDKAASGGAPACRIFDTRKTIPGWRALDKYAVRCGGGHNHRQGLFDAILLKDNHLAGIPVDRLAAALTEMLGRSLAVGWALPTNSSPPPAICQMKGRLAADATNRARMEADSSTAPASPTASESVGRAHPTFIEIEIDSLAQFPEVAKVPGVNIILLDNFKPDQMREAVKLRDSLGLRGKIELEASGGVTLETVAAIASTGVDRIAIGALTHSAPALDIALDFAP